MFACVSLCCCVFVFTVCISDQRILVFAGREFYSSVSKHPEQSQWPSEAGRCSFTSRKWSAHRTAMPSF